MADIRPFRAVRPNEGLESKIAALPYDVYNREEAKKEVEREPKSFLRIDRAETNFPDNVDTYDDCVYQCAHDLLWDMIKKQQMVQEDAECYYIYELTRDGRTQTGLAACASVEDYRKQVIKKHENTREDKELDRIRHVDACNAQTGPIFLAYRRNDMIHSIMEETKKEKPLFDFISPDNISHRVWRMQEERKISKIQNAFLGMEQIYIADGHHRCASAERVAAKRREENPNHTGLEEYNYFLSVLFPDDELLIMDYNRVVKDLNGLSEDKFLKEVSKSFQVTKVEESPYRPNKKEAFGMFLSGTWYELIIEDCLLTDDPVEGLAVSLLQKYLLEPILGITEPKTDARIGFVGGIRGLEELERRVHTDCKVAFSLYPTTIQELFSVADAGLLMPPKSTWFEPKLRSGLFIHLI